MKIWVVEGKFMKKPWRFCEGFETEAQAHFHARRMTNGLYPVWRYRVRSYSPQNTASVPIKYRSASK